MEHRASMEDRRFIARFEAGAVEPAEFDHRAHVRLAYVHLVDGDADSAYATIRRGLHAFLASHGIDGAKYHDTLTRAWVLAVQHFMTRTPGCASAAEFIERTPAILDPGIMATHYSKERLFSDRARAQYIPPDLDPIPGGHERGA